MNKLKKVLLTILLFIPCIVLAEGSITIDKEELSIEIGKNASFVITPKDATGTVKIASKDPETAKVDKAEGKLEKDSLTIKVDGIKEGKTEVTVDIEGTTTDKKPIKETKTIKVDVVKEKSSNNNIESITIDGEPLTGLEPGKLLYALGTTKSSTVTVEATAAHEKAKVTGTGKKVLKYGKNTIGVVVEAENGAKKTYRLTITRVDERNADNSLKSLSVDVGDIKFKPDTTSYILQVDHKVEKVNIKAEANDKTAKVAGTGEKKLKDYMNAFSVVVTAENQTKKTYTIKIRRADAKGDYGKLSTDNNLKSLSVEGYSIAFKKEMLEYDLLIEEEVDALEIKASPSADVATVDIIGNEDLEPGPNEITIKVTSESGEAKEYLLHVYKKGEIKREEDSEYNFYDDEVEETTASEDANLGINTWTWISLVLFIINVILLFVIRGLIIKINS